MRKKKKKKKKANTTTNQDNTNQKTVKKDPLSQTCPNNTDKNTTNQNNCTVPQDKRCYGSDIEEDDVEEDNKAIPINERPEIEREAIILLEQLIEKFPQTEINGSNNIWIVKPAGLSRGRGIKIYGSWVEINRALRDRNCCWIVQKYIENPALISFRKFDIRQWVMVTDWNP